MCWRKNHLRFQGVTAHLKSWRRLTKFIQHFITERDISLSSHKHAHPKGCSSNHRLSFSQKKKLRPYPWSIHGATRLAKVGHIFGKVEGKVVGWSGSLGWLVTMKKQSNQVDLLNKVWSQLEQIWSGCYSPGVRVARVATKGAFWAHPRDLTCDWQPGPRPTWSSPLDGWCQNISKCRWKWSSREETRGTSVFRYSSRLIFQPFVAVQSAVVHSLVFPA